MDTDFSLSRNDKKVKVVDLIGKRYIHIMGEFKMNQANCNLNWWWLRLLLIIPLVMAVEAAPANPYIKIDSSSAVTSLLNDALESYKKKEYEQSSALLERALRIMPRHPILWYNLAGVRLAQGQVKRAANLAQKSNALAGTDNKYRQLRVRNWELIARACEGMDNMKCAREAKKRALALLQTW
jgi:tetratricopeptide (TPR) repeat protein